MYRNILIYLLLTLSFSLSAQASYKKVVLLTAIDGIPDTKLYKDIEDYFTKYMHNYSIETIVGATQEDLYDQLNNSSNHAVFWVSHANSYDSDGAESILSGVVTDSRGVNVEPLFQKVNPNIKWIGIIGCNTLNIAEALQTHNTYKQKFFGIDGKTLPINGLSKAIRNFKYGPNPRPGVIRKASRKSLYKKTTEIKTNNEVKKVICEKKTGLKIKASGLNQLSDSLQVIYKGKFQTLLENTYTLDDNKTFFIPMPSPGKLTFRVNSGLKSSQENELSVNILLNFSTTNNEIDFSVVKNKYGEPIGKTTHLYKSKQPIPAHLISEYNICTSSK